MPGLAEPHKIALGQIAFSLSRHVCARRGFELQDCKSGPWRLLSGQMLADDVALVAAAGACWQEMAWRWCRLSTDQWFRRGPIPSPAHWMDHPSACCSHLQAGQVEPECLLSGTRHSLAGAATALAALAIVAGQGAVPEFLWAAMFAAAPLAAIEPWPQILLRLLLCPMSFHEMVENSSRPCPI